VYGDWLFGKKYTIKWVTPAHQMSIIGNFLVAALGASQACGQMKEEPKLLFMVGALFWLIVMVALFVRLSSSFKSLHEKPNPTLVLFIAPPAAAALAWGLIVEADSGLQSVSEGPDIIVSFFYFIDFYLYLLVFRISRSFGSQPFAVVFWALIFPTSTAASASVVVAFRAKGHIFWQVISAMFVILATVAILYVAVLTIVNLVRGKFIKDPSAVETYAAAVMESSHKSMRSEKGMNKGNPAPSGVDAAADKPRRNDSDLSDVYIDVSHC